MPPADQRLYRYHLAGLDVRLRLVVNLKFRAFQRSSPLGECLLADQEPVRKFLLAGLEPSQHLRFEEAERGIGGGGGGRLVLLQFIGD
jgi:hypothetical protein